MSGAYLAALAGVDTLYERVVNSPESWTDAMLTDWAEETLGGGSAPSRDLARELRRCVRAARKMRDFWLDPPPGVPSDAGEWRTRVDVALGIRAWRPLLGIAQAGLEAAPPKSCSRRRSGDSARCTLNTGWRASRTTNGLASSQGPKQGPPVGCRYVVGAQNLPALGGLRLISGLVFGRLRRVNDDGARVVGADQADDPST